MIKKEIRFLNFDDQPTSEVHYFHLSNAELVQFDESVEGGFTSTITKIIESDDKSELIAQIKNLIRLSYGVRSEDGRKFTKTPEAVADFEDTLAYLSLLDELLTDGERTTEFLTGLLSKGLQEKLVAMENVELPEPKELPAVPPAERVRMDGSRIAEARRDSGLAQPFDSDGNLLPWWCREPTEKELRLMGPDQLRDVFARKASGFQPSTSEVPSLLEMTAPDIGGDWNREQTAYKSALGDPYDESGKLVPWWNRDPTPQECETMTDPQLTDVYRRKSSGWTPPAPAQV